MVDYEFTARLEDNLDKISRGEQDSITCIKDTYEPFRLNLEEKLETVDISEQRLLKDLGIHPTTKRPVSVRLTKYGPTIQMCTKEDEEKPKWAALTYEQKNNIDAITLDDAIRLFELPEPSVQVVMSLPSAKPVILSAANHRILDAESPTPPGPVCANTPVAPTIAQRRISALDRRL